MFLPRRILEEKLLGFLKEDLGLGDATAYLVIDDGTIAEAEIVMRESGIVAGLEEAIVLCESLKLKAKALKQDGAQVKPQTPILHIVGDARTLLSAERTILNMLSRMSGISTMTSSLVHRVAACGTRVACTRKVAPGLGYFDKKAVLLGGGDMHRLHLDDMVLIKDSHIKIAGSVSRAVRRAHETVSFSKKVEVEVSSAEDALRAARAGADIIMLDNLSSKSVRKIARTLTKEGVRQKVILEASGGMNEKNIIEYAETGVDVISVGGITHSPKSLDMSLVITKVVR